MPVFLKRRFTTISPLMWRILAVNTIALAILGAGALYLNQFRQNLIERMTADLRAQAEIIAGALGETPSLGPESLDLDLTIAQQVVHRLVGSTQTRARLFAPNGNLVLDSRFFDPNRSIQETPLAAPGSGWGWLNKTLRGFSHALDLMGSSGRFAPYVERPKQSATDYPEAVDALMGETRTQIRSKEEGIAVITAAAPVQRFRRVLGAILLSRDTEEIQAIVNQERLTIVKIFAASLTVTLLLSLFLGRTIAKPIQQLAIAADKLRHGSGGTESFSRFSHRHDEIGALSRALSNMTQALHHQIDATENFTADVAHELKNPLSSLRSAIETAQHTDDKDVHDKMIAIAQEDILRLSRLINDISDASRIDSELARAVMEKVDFGKLLKTIVSTYQHNSKRLAQINMSSFQESVFIVKGVESRLAQVIYNLIDNSLSFTPKNKHVLVSLAHKKDNIEFMIEDEGPGLPFGAEEKIFERFYSERPSQEAFGTHSGLGLSIARQIVRAHGGSIYAENRLPTTDKTKGQDQVQSSQVLGARFVVHLPRANF